LAIFPDVVESSSNLASDAAGVAGHTAPKSPDARIPAPDLTPADVGEVEETCPQVVADAPSQLIREICNRVFYPHASKTTSRANPGVAEKHTTPACARQAVAQGNGGARKKATQGGESRKGNQSNPRRRARKSDSRKCHRSSSRSSSSSSSSSTDSSVVSEELFLNLKLFLLYFSVLYETINIFFGFEICLRSHYLLQMTSISPMNGRS
jgi:hypothetical protein